MTVFAVIGLIALCLALAMTASKYREAARQWQDAGEQWATAARTALRIARTSRPAPPVDSGAVAAGVDGRVIGLVRRPDGSQAPRHPQYPQYLAQSTDSPTRTQK